MYRKSAGKDTLYSIQIKTEKYKKKALKNIRHTHTHAVYMYTYSILKNQILEPMLSHNSPEKLFLQLYQIGLAEE